MRRLNRNPRDESLLKRITIEPESAGFRKKYYVYHNNELIALAIYNGYGSCTIEVAEGYKRRGVATFLYDYIEKDIGRKLKPSSELFPDSKAFWANRLKKNPMKTRSKTSKRKSSCKCKGSCSLRKCSCFRRKNPLDGKIPTREFRNLNPDKYYVFHLYGNVSQWGKPVLSDSKRFVVESNSERTIHFWEDLLNVYGPFTTSKQAIDAWKKLLTEGYL